MFEQSKLPQELPSILDGLKCALAQRKFKKQRPVVNSTTNVRTNIDKIMTHNQIGKSNSDHNGMTVSHPKGL